MLNPNYLFCARFRWVLSSFFYILLLIDRVKDVPLVFRKDIWSSREKITTEGWDEANIHYLFCASSFYILLLIERVIHVLLVSRNYKWPSRNKRYLLRGGMKLISKAKLKYLFCAHFKLLLSLSPDGLIDPACSSGVQKWWMIFLK